MPGTLGPDVFAGSEPNQLAVSVNSKYLYVGLDGASQVQRFTLPNLVKDINLDLGSNPYCGLLVAYDLESSPIADGTVAIAKGAPGCASNGAGGVWIYDDGTPRPSVVCGFGERGCIASTGSAQTVSEKLRGDAFQYPADYGGLSLDSIQWNADGSALFASNTDNSGFDFYSVPVTAAGFGTISDYPGLASTRIHFDRVTRYLYENNGAILDPVAAVRVGAFISPNLSPDISLVVPDGSVGVAFLLWQNYQAGGTSAYSITSYDMLTLAPIGTATFLKVAGLPSHFIRWGSNGLAFTTSPSDVAGPGSAVYILSGPFVSKGPFPSINPGGVVAADSTSNIVQAGEWISIYGSGFASSTYTWGGNFPTSLGGVSVTINGRPAYLSYVSPTQINLQVPDDFTTGSVPVVVTTPITSATSSVIFGEFGPSFLLLDSSHVAGIILRADGSGAYGGGTYDILGPTGTSLGYPTVAARAGDSVALYAVGFGPTSPAVAAGQPFSGTAVTTNPVALVVNKVLTTPNFAGMTGAGLYQINFVIPPGLGSGDVTLRASVGGFETQVGVLVSLQ